MLFDRASNPGNLGTILRSLRRPGADGLILTGHGVDLYDPEVIVSSMGSFFRVPAVRAADNNSVFQFIESLRQRTWASRCWAPPPTSSTPLYGQDLTGPVLDGGQRDPGPVLRLLKEGLRQAGHHPHGGTSYASSFNVACAATVMLYEVSRQRSPDTRNPSPVGACPRGFFERENPEKANIPLEFFGKNAYLMVYQIAAPAAHGKVCTMMQLGAQLFYIA